MGKYLPFSNRQAWWLSPNSLWGPRLPPFSPDPHPRQPRLLHSLHLGKALVPWSPRRTQGFRWGRPAPSERGAEASPARLLGETTGRDPPPSTTCSPHSAFQTPSSRSWGLPPRQYWQLTFYTGALNYWALWSGLSSYHSDQSQRKSEPQTPGSRNICNGDSLVLGSVYRWLSMGQALCKRL